MIDINSEIEKAFKTTQYYDEEIDFLRDLVRRVGAERDSYVALLKILKWENEQLHKQLEGKSHD